MERGTSNPPALTWSDAWLLAALAEGCRKDKRVGLRTFVQDADWLNHAVPTFDEISFGFPRLVAAGYLTIGSSSTRGLTLLASPEAMRLRRSVKAHRRGDEIIGMASLVGAPRQPRPELEDRSLGRLKGLEPEDWDKAIHEYGASVDRWSKPFVAAARVIVWWQNRKGS